MMRGNLERYTHFRALAAAHTLQRVRRGKMCDVQAGVRNLHCELQVALHNRGFGGSGHAAQSEAERARAGVHRAVFSHARIFGMLHDREIQLSAQQQSLAHNAVIEDGLAIVGDRNGSGGLQGAEVGKGGALAGARRGSNGKDIDDRAALGLTKPLDPLVPCWAWYRLK